jgi:hypothetical protein
MSELEKAKKMVERRNDQENEGSWRLKRISGMIIWRHCEKSVKERCSRKRHTFQQSREELYPILTWPFIEMALLHATYWSVLSPVKNKRD